jgi:hypothetical protein
VTFAFIGPAKENPGHRSNVNVGRGTSLLLCVLAFIGEGSELLDVFVAMLHNATPAAMTFAEWRPDTMGLRPAGF